MSLPPLLAFLTLFSLTVSSSSSSKTNLTLMTVASDSNDGFKRYMRSAQHFGYEVQVLGMGRPWLGGDMTRPGGGYKINLLREALEELKEEDRVVMFTDAYDVVINDKPEVVLQKFDAFAAGVVFSAEPFIWPKASLETQYPQVEPHQKRFLNSGGIIGKAKDLYAVLTNSAISNEDDDQLFYTLAYLDENIRTKHSIRLDHDSDIFMNINGAKNEIVLKFDETTGRPLVQNKKSKTFPSVLHGNGPEPSKVRLNWWGNYLADAWTEKDGCKSCEERTVDISDAAAAPKVLIAVFVDRPTPFFPEFLARVAALRYPKKAVDFFIHVGVDFHSRHVDDFRSRHGNDYRSFHLLTPESRTPDSQAREAAFHEGVRRGVDYVFALDSIAQLTNPDTLRLLMETDKSIVAPLLSRPKKLWSNFWGDIGSDGFYLRSDDYVEIVQRTRLGVWNSPFISDAILTHSSKFSAAAVPSFYRGDWDQDMAFSANMRQQDHFLFVTNQHVFGHLVNADHFNTSHFHSDMYEMFENRLDWEEKYIHPNYTQNLLPDFLVEQPCPDVYRFPLFTEVFTVDLIEEMENFGQWSGGGHQGANDPRLSGGYENVPTVDIHMNQINFHDHWIQILKDYVNPIQQKVFPGFYSKSNALMNFVVRYKPNEQDYLKPHHDSSTFTINVALNRAGVDYEGGGCRFLRYDCRVTDSARGWALIHPGRLTHYHEGLRTTKGVRYIMVSFVDP